MTTTVIAVVISVLKQESSKVSPKDLSKVGILVIMIGLCMSSRRTSILATEESAYLWNCGSSHGVT